MFLLSNCHFESDLELTKIDGFPNEINGCSCYFAKNKEDFDQEKFIYLDNYYSGTGYISINGKLIKVDMDNPDKNEFVVNIEFESDRQSGDETWWKTGTMTVTSKEGKTLKSNFVGECGC